jgi:hypothetical protein
VGRGFDGLLEAGQEILVAVLLVGGQAALAIWPCRSYPLAPEADKRPGQVTRLLRRPYAHGLVAKIPHSRRWRVSLAGRRTMAAAIKLREVAYPSLFAAAA